MSLRCLIKILRILNKLVGCKSVYISEVWLILKHVRADYKPYYTIRFFTGMRTSEIDGLKWDCINFDRREISIRGALVNGEMGPTKTLGSQRDIAMSQLVYDALLSRKHVPMVSQSLYFATHKAIRWNTAM